MRPSVCELVTLWHPTIGCRRRWLAPCSLSWLRAPARWSQVVRPEMRIKLQVAIAADALDIVALRAAVAAKLTAQYGQGPWSGVSTEKGVLFDLRTSRVFVARRKSRLVATLRLTTKKPWAIDRQYFTPCSRPLYLLSMAAAPELQRQGIGRLCLAEVREICRQWPADAIRLDAFAAPAGAWQFYGRCDFREVGRASYRGCPLVYFEMLL